LCITTPSRCRIFSKDTEYGIRVVDDGHHLNDTKRRINKNHFDIIVHYNKHFIYIQFIYVSLKVQRTLYTHIYIFIKKSTKSLAQQVNTTVFLFYTFSLKYNIIFVGIPPTHTRAYTHIYNIYIITYNI